MRYPSASPTNNRGRIRMSHTFTRPQWTLAMVVFAASALPAQVTPQGEPAKPDTAVTLRAVTVRAERAEATSVSVLQRLTLPVTVGITQLRAEQTVNLVDVQDAVKYLPSIFVRKRNNGDTQSTLATRVWGPSSSARSLVFADGVPLTALVANNNTVGGPRWGLVSPLEVARVDMMYGPYSAAYSGNSMGAVMEIATRMPEHREGTISQTQAVQKFALYGTSKTYGTTQTNVDFGDRFGNLSFWASGNYQNSNS